MIASPLYKNQNIFILGLGRSGRSVAQSLTQAGAHVLAWDDHAETRKAALDQGIPLADLDALDWRTIDQLILSPGIPHRYPAPHPLVLKASSPPISDLEVLYHSQPDVQYIGITGSNGKSTTTALIGHVLKQIHHPVEVGGNIGIPVMDLQSLGKDGTYVLELSSYQLETSPSLHCNISILLNITPDHLDRHGGMEGYIKAKKLIYKNSTPQDMLVISVDDAPCLQIYETIKATGQVRLLPISINKTLPDGIYVKDGVIFEQSTPVFDLKQLERLRGPHNWQNIAAAYAALRIMGLESDQILKGVSSFPGLVHRQQVIAQHKNVLFVNDSKATNADAVAKALESYKDLPIYWLLGGVPKDGGITTLAPYFPNIRHGFLFGEAASSFATTLEGHVPYTLCETLDEAVKKAAVLASKDQEKVVVLLSPACASFDQFKDFEARGEAFCEAVKRVMEGE